MESNLTAIKKNARLAGILYVIWTISGLFALIYVPSKIFVKGDTVATTDNILAHEFLFRTSIVNDLINSAIGIVMILVLYQLFKQVNDRQAKLMVALLIVQIPIAFVMDAFNVTSLMILKGEVLKTFELAQRQDLAMAFLKINDYGTIVLETFWGAWLFPLAALVYSSRFLPRFLGVWLMINGFAYVVLSFTMILFPQYKDIVYYATLPACFGELAFALWLLIRGAKLPS